GATVCPLGTDLGGQFCQNLQQQQCQAPVPTTTSCRPMSVVINGPGQPPTAQQCSCFDSNTTCGAVGIQNRPPGDYLLTCQGPCNAMPGWICRLHVNGMPVSQSSIPASSLPAGSIVTCRCAP